MSQEIRRLHQKHTQFTNFSSSQTNELPNSNEPSELNTKDNSDQPVRRLRRRRQSDSSPNIDDVSAFPNPIKSNELDVLDDSSKPVRSRPRRRQSDSSSKDISSSLNPSESTEQSVKEDYKDTPLVNNAVPILSFNNINAIRAEFQEDAYHRKLAESNFSDDTHDWGGDLHELSDDYWHFVGSFE